MRVKLRDELDFSKKINLRRLSPMMKIYAGVVSMYRDSEAYKRGLQKKVDAAKVMQMQKDDQLKQVILATAIREFGKNSQMFSEGKVCESIIISLSKEYKPSFDRITGHYDFLPYNLEIIPENEDIRKAFSDMPYLVRISKKLVKGDGE